MKADLLFAHHGDIVFSLAGNCAGAAANAHIEIHHHSPLVTCVRKFRRVIERVIVWRKLFRLLRVVRVSEKLSECAVMQNAPALDHMMMLRGDEPLASSGFSNT